MKLGEYLATNRLTQGQFGAMVRAAQPAVSRWVRGVRIPQKLEMGRIFAATNGEVDANDFFDLPKPRKCDCPPKKPKRG
jgi:hypothetical protein